MSMTLKQGCRTCRFTLNERDADRLRAAARHAGFKDLDVFAHGLVQMGLAHHEERRSVFAEIEARVREESKRRRSFFGRLLDLFS